MCQTVVFLKTPLGPLRVTSVQQGIVSVEFVVQEATSQGATEGLAWQAARQLQEYFEGTRRTFDPFPIVCTPSAFRRSVWDALCKVPYGQTRTYGQVAAMVGNASAARAVGAAVAANPLAILIPCHRIVPGDRQDVGGFAWGADRKRWLLTHEQGAQEPLARP